VDSQVNPQLSLGGEAKTTVFARVLLLGMLQRMGRQIGLLRERGAADAANERSLAGVLSQVIGQQPFGGERLVAVIAPHALLSGMQFRVVPQLGHSCERFTAGARVLFVFVHPLVVPQTGLLRKALAARFAAKRFLAGVDTQVIGEVGASEVLAADVTVFRFLGVMTEDMLLQTVFADEALTAQLTDEASLVRMQF